MPAKNLASSSLDPTEPTSARSSLREAAFHAHRAIQNALPRRKGRGKASGRTEAEEPLGDSAEAVRGMREELLLERREVLEPLLRRLTQIGQCLEAEEVPAEVIRDGLDLWQEYVSRLYDVHVGQFAATRPLIRHEPSCILPLAELEQSPERAQLRIQEVRTLLTGYVGRAKLYRPFLAAAMVGNSRSELAWEVLEEEFVAECLPKHLPATALKAWAAALKETRTAAEETRAKLEKFLDRTSRYAQAGPEPRREPAIPAPSA